MAKNLHVLIVEDSENDHELLTHALQGAGFEISALRVTTAESMREALQQKKWDIVLSDYSLPGFNGLAALELFKASGQDQPFIVVSGMEQEELAVSLVKAGAHGFVRKGNLSRLAPVVEQELSEAVQRRFRKLAEDELRESHLQLNQALEASGLGAFSWDIVTGNAWYALRCDHILGYAVPPAHVDFETFMSRVVPEERDQMRQKFERAFANGDFDLNCKINRFDGAQASINLRGKVLGNEAGKPVRAIGIMMDMTEREQTEESLTLFRALIDQSNDAFEVIDPGTGKFIDLNERAWRRLGYSRDEMLSMAVTDVEVTTLNPFSMPKITEEIQETGFKLMEGRHRRKDGSTFPVEANLRYVQLHRRDYVVAVVRDITERRQAEERIAEQASFLDKAQDAIIVRDLEGTILFWNKGAENMYGWARQEMVGRKVDELYYADAKTFAAANETTLSKGEWSGQLVHLTRDQREIIVEGRWTLIRDAEGNPKSVLAINTDITEKKSIEDQYFRAQRMESIGTLAGGIAHDLNNILAPILLSIDVLKATTTHPQAKNILSTIEDSAKRGADIVRHVLSFARGVEGQRIEVQPRHILREVESIIKETFPKDIRLQTFIPNDSWTILGDPTQIHQILLNLCLNARDAMPQGGELSIRVENSVIDEHYAAMNLQARPGRYVKISVNDTGTGIPPELIDKIFEPFFTTKELNKGTGLGLSTALAIIKSHTGFIHVYSELGRGTAFRIYLPVVESSPGAQQKMMEQIGLPRGNGETVLVIDDEASILAITSQTLQAYGYRVLTSVDGAEALAVYVEQKTQIAVVLTDMAMPIMDGAAMIRALMKINPKVKIVGTSGLGANGNAARAAGEGVRRFLTKPFTAATLLKTMRTVLDEP